MRDNRKDRPNKTLQITPSRFVAAFTRTSGLATHITPKLDHFGSGQLSFLVRCVRAATNRALLALLENQSELSLTSLAPARSPLPRGVTVYPATAPPAVFS